jgi:hypothetical protein
MKKNLLIALAVCLASVAVVAAQSYNTIRVTLPYPVVIGSTTLPAGDFVITDTDNHGSSSLILVRSDAGPGATLLMERTSNPSQSFADHSDVHLRQVAGGYAIESLEISGQVYRVPLR